MMGVSWKSLPMLFLFLAVLAILALGCFEPGPVEEGGDCDSEGQLACDGSTVLVCEELIWEVDDQCKTSELCVIEDVTNSSGTVYAKAFCTEPDGSGDYCLDEVTEYEEKCSGNTIFRCGSSGKWVEDKQCTSAQSCVVNELTDSYGSVTSKGYCVNSDGSGDYCFDEAKKYDEKCSGNTILRCSSAGKWSNEKECQVGETCSVTTVTDTYGEDSQEASCE